MHGSRRRPGRQAREFSGSHGQRAMWEAVPDAELDRVREQYTAAAQECADPHGGITFTQDVRYTLGVRP